MCDSKEEEPAVRVVMHASLHFVVMTCIQWALKRRGPIQPHDAGMGGEGVMRPEERGNSGGEKPL